MLPRKLDCLRLSKDPKTRSKREVASSGGTLIPNKDTSSLLVYGQEASLDVFFAATENELKTGPLAGSSHVLPFRNERSLRFTQTF